ncbi:hypothetical protein STEG23_015859, partial [Scotinomys teguina]
CLCESSSCLTKQNHQEQNKKRHCAQPVPPAVEERSVRCSGAHDGSPEPPYAPQPDVTNHRSSPPRFQSQGKTNTTTCRCDETVPREQ